MNYSLPRRGTLEFERELAAIPPRWRWFVDVPGSPRVPMFIAAMAALGYRGLWPYMTGRQRAGTAVAGWVFLGGFGALVLWFAWFVVRIILLSTALGLGAIWGLYAAGASIWQHHRKAQAAAPS